MNPYPYPQYQDPSNPYAQYQNPSNPNQNPTNPASNPYSNPNPFGQNPNAFGFQNQNQNPNELNKYPSGGANYNNNVIPMAYQQQQHYMNAQNDVFYNPYFNMQGQTYQDVENAKPEPLFKPNPNPPAIYAENNLNGAKDHDLNLNHDKYMVFFQYDSVNVFAFDFIDRKYMKCPNYYNFTMLSFFRVAQTPEFTFILTGGSSGDDIFSNNTYHYVDGYFYKQNDMKVARRAHCSVYLNKYVYVFGGMNQMGQLRHCERFEVATNRWEEIAPMAQERTLASCCVFGKDKIYIIGGFNEMLRQDLIDIEFYDVGLNCFRKAPCQTPLKVENPFVAQINECEIAILGGFNYENSTESDNISVVNVFNGKSDFRGKMPKPCWSAYCHPYLIRPDTFMIFYNGEDEFFPAFSEVTIQ